MTPAKEAADAGDIEDPEFRDSAHCRAALHRRVVESSAELDNPEFGDAPHWWAALHRFVASPAKEAADAGDTEDPKFGDAAHCGAALHRSIAIPAKEAADVGAARVVDTPGTAPVVKEAAENAVGVSQIVGATKAAETPGAARDAARITLEGAKEPEQLSSRKLLS